MPRFRLNPLTGNAEDIGYIKNENIESSVIRALADHNLELNRQTEESILVTIGGYQIERGMWPHIRPKKHAAVVISVVPRGDDTFGQVLTLAAIVGATYFAGAPVASGGLGLTSGWATSAFVGGVAITMSLAINGMTSPPTLGIGDGNLSNYEDSQMFTITSQSNQMKKYGGVPRVYGRHRVFPVIAANPYTDIEVDPVTGELIQYFYAIYDFGYGPLMVNDIKIGDTFIDNYTDFDIRLVDINKPEVSTGDWDDILNDSFTLYKGDVAVSDVSAVINKNQNDSGAHVSEYQSTRTASSNPEGHEQEIITNFVFPSGLFTVNTSGDQLARGVELKIEFADVGTEDWHSYDDTDYVESFDRGFEELEDIYLPDNFDVNAQLGLGDQDQYDRMVFSLPSYSYNPYFGDRNLDGAFFIGIDPLGSRNKYEYRVKGILKGLSDRIASDTLVAVGTEIRIRGRVWGRVQAVTPRPDGGYWLEMPVAGFSEPLFYDIIRLKRAIVGGVYGDVKIWVPDGSLGGSLYYRDFKGYGADLPFPEFDKSGPSLIRPRSFKDGVLEVSESVNRALFASVRFTPKSKNQTKVRVTRVRSTGGASFQIVDDMTWISMTTKFDTQAIRTKERHVFAEIRIKATDQLNGAIQNLSAVCSSVLDVYDPDTDTWNKEITSSPPWVYADILTGSVNRRAVDKSRLDTASLVEWRDYCDQIPLEQPTGYDDWREVRFECNFVLDYRTTINRLLEQITSGAQASVNLVDGKYGVLVDQTKTTPVQVFTPRNSWGFSSSRGYVDVPHALKVKYIDEGSGWEVKERIVYSDGFDELTATTFEDIDTFGCTNEEQSWRYGRYMLAQAKFRQENITISVDFEHLVCTRGDYVKITQDVMRVGGVPARVKTVAGSTVTIDDNFTTQPATNYGYIFRDASGVIEESTLTVTAPDTFVLDGTIPAVGDLFVIGEVDSVTYDCIVKSIVPSDDLTAQLVLVEKNDEIFDAEHLDSFSDYDPQISSVLDSSATAPAPVESLLVNDNTYECGNGEYVYYMDLVWSVPSGAVYELFEIYTDIGSGYELVDYSSVPAYKYIVDSAILGTEHKFKVLAVSSTGAKISLGEAIEVSATPLVKTVAPSDVAALYINITNQMIQLDWDSIEDCDVANYLIRYSPSDTATWESSVELLTTDSITTLASAQGRTGTYLIKAIDWAGNQSVNAAIAKTSIPDLFDLNIIEETNDFPTFAGTREQVEVLSNELILEEKTVGGTGIVEYYPEGYYYYDSFLDLGDIYTVRLQSLIEAEGYAKDDLMANWVTLSGVSVLSSTAVGEWNVETYYRGTDSFNVISDWATLSSIDPLSEGAQDQWTSWRKFTIGDFTARIFQFRLRLVSNKASVSPRVFDAKIKSDMPDRIDNYDNITAPNTGYTLTYTPAFKGPSTTPNIQISQDNATQGDYYKITNKTLTEFDITFYDKNDVAVQRQFDAMVKGYGRKHTTTI